MPVSNEMKTHLQGTVTTAVFMKITANDGSVLAVWNGTRDKIVDGVIYYAFPIAPSRLQSAAGLKADNLEITSIYSDVFNSVTLRSGKWQGARIEYRVLNYKDFSMGYAERRLGFLGVVKVGKYSATPELKSLAQKLSEVVGGSMQADCDVVEFGDARCGKDLNGNTEAGFKIKIGAHVVAPILNRQQFSVAFDGHIKPSDTGVTTAPDSHYRRGKIKFTSGSNNGAEMQILESIGNALTLYLPAYYTVNDGDTLELTSGCDRKIGTCRDIYNNAANNRSFFMLPGRDAVLKIPE
jgi:uncharacterized phage protein (TIGR02218 family)